MSRELRLQNCPRDLGHVGEWRYVCILGPLKKWAMLLVIEIMLKRNIRPYYQFKPTTLPEFYGQTEIYML